MSATLKDGLSLAGKSLQQHSAAIAGARSCVIQIANHSGYESLVEPNTYMFHGFCHIPPQTTIPTQTKDAISFSSDLDGSQGAVGILSYRLGKASDKRLAIMYSIPYDFNFYDSWFGLAFINAAAPTNAELYNEMYYGYETANLKRGKARGGGALNLTDCVWTVTATLSAGYAAMLEVEIKKEGEPAVAVQPLVTGHTGGTYTVIHKTVKYN